MTEGSKSSEFRLTVWVALFGAALDGASIVLHTLQGQGVHGAWLSGALALCGTLLMIATALGYQRSRTMVKLGGQVPVAAQAVREEVLPLAAGFQELVAELREVRLGNLPPPAPPEPQPMPRPPPVAQAQRRY